MSDGCEAMVELYNHEWARCWRQPTESHHMLTRARGGRILDEVGETYHKIACCRVCHDGTHGGGGLEIDGYVTTDNQGRPVYHGTDEYLTNKYGPGHVWPDTDERAEETS
jgi:hypothetical protein